jgi:UDP:flavonoid glycosyltransferase YjiC (YdhE family)
MGRKKILFVGEAATLAHVARPLTLAAALDREHFDVSFACDPRYRWVLSEFSGRFFSLQSVGSDHFLSALARGAPVYDTESLRRYVEEDLKLLAEASPDIVVGDFRLSLSISARLTGIPYVGISNCYWSPYWRPRRYVVPSLPLTRCLPLSIADALFRLARPIAFALHCRPLNRVRRQYGLSSLGNDLRRIYTDADYVVYADIAELFTGVTLPAEHRMIGPVLWSPPVQAPAWWSSIEADRPVLYITMGSSGVGNLLPEILRSLGPLDVTVIAASAGNAVPDAVPANAHVTRYLPGLEAAQRASLVICNGGAPTCHQALSAGIPVIGLPTNLDQFLNMDTLVEAEVGVVHRADRFSAAKLRGTVNAMLTHRNYREAAEHIARAARENDARANFRGFLERLLTP